MNAVRVGARVYAEDAMIDNPAKTRRLLSELEASLPLDARVTPWLAATLQNSVPDLRPLQPCRITEVHYAGDEGGIVCRLDLAGNDGKAVFLASITHLAFDPRRPLARQVAAYQKHRIKKIRYEGNVNPAVERA